MDAREFNAYPRRGLIVGLGVLNPAPLIDYTARGQSSDDLESFEGRTHRHLDDETTG
jgi:hypothetical protein